MVWKGDASARLAKGLITLIDQVDAKWSNRSRHSDGSIGDRAHAARVSDHNPGSDGVVEALDITHDPDNGVDTWKLAEILRQNKDRRIDYVISNGRVFVGLHGKWNGKNIGPWKWVKYNGQNSHAQHIHVSVDPRPAIYDLTDPWKLDAVGATAPAPSPPKPKGVTAVMRRRMMEAILSYEGRFEGGDLKVFVAPDGLPEIGGITQKDHPSVYAKLKGILDSGDQKKLREAVLQYYEQYTAQAQNWTDRPGVEFVLRDCILNRGPDGAAEILQMALGVAIDRQIGPTTRGALAALDADVAIDKISASRELYEDKHFDNGNGLAWRKARGQLDGLKSRWKKTQAQARIFQAQSNSAAPETGGAGAIIVGGGTAAAEAARQGMRPWQIALIVALTVIIAAAVFVAVRNARNKKGQSR